MKTFILFCTALFNAIILTQCVFVPSPSVRLTRPNKFYQSYNKIISCFPSDDIQHPDSVEELMEIVNFAIERKIKIKALGTLHSASDLICTSGIPIDMHKINHIHLNPSDKSVTAGAGIEVMDLLNFLHDNNRGLIQMPTFGGITLGGALGAGVHGSSLIHPATLSDQVISLKIVDGTGQFRFINDTEELKAFRVHLGLLGIIIEVTLKTVPQYKLRVEIEKANEEVLFDGKLLKMAEKFDFFQFFWSPNEDSVILNKGRYVSVITAGNSSVNLIPDTPEWEVTIFSNAIETFQALRARPGLQIFESYSQKSLYTFVFGKPPIYTENERIFNIDKKPAIGFSHRMMINRCTQCAWLYGDNSIYVQNFDFVLDRKYLPRVAKMVKNVMAEAPAQFPLISIYCRFVKPSESFMAVEDEQHTLHIEFTVQIRRDQYNTAVAGIDAVQAILQIMSDEFQARAHWGKSGLHYYSRDILEQSFPKKERFILQMKKYDPEGIFMNDFGRRLLGISNKQTRDVRVTHCALQDYCICRKNSDCAPFQRCDILHGRNVCKDN